MERNERNNAETRKKIGCWWYNVMKVKFGQ